MPPGNKKEKAPELFILKQFLLTTNLLQFVYYLLSFTVLDILTTTGSLRSIGVYLYLSNNLNRETPLKYKKHTQQRVFSYYLIKYAYFDKMQFRTVCFYQ